MTYRDRDRDDRDMRMDDRDRSRSEGDMSGYGRGDRDRSMGMGGRGRFEGGYERDMMDRSGPIDGRGDYDRGGRMNDRDGSGQADRQYGMDRGGAGIGYGALGSGMDRGSTGMGNSYQMGLGGTGAYNPDRGNGGPRGGMDRDMGNLERDMYGRGSVARGDMMGGMSSREPHGGVGGGRRDGMSGMSGGMDRPMGQHYGRGPRNYQRADDRICEEINEQLTYHHDIDATDIEVSVQGGEATLTGTVTDRRQKRLAEDIAESVRGVRDVHNQIRVQQQGMGMGMGSSGGQQASTLVVTPNEQGNTSGTSGMSGNMSGTMSGSMSGTMGSMDETSESDDRNTNR